MPFLVDGSNLGGVLGGTAGARDRPAVIRRLMPLARGGRRVLVVFDGPASGDVAAAYGTLEVRFAAAQSADRMLLALLGPRPAEWQVVTDDRALAAACRERGAHVLSVAALLARVERAAAAESGAGGEAPVDVADWEEWFRRGGGEEGGER